MKFNGRTILLMTNAFLLTMAGSRGDEPREPSQAESRELPATILSWDTTEKEQSLKNGETLGAFDFTMTNSGAQPVEVTQINVSCGCTSVTGRTMPFTLKPGDKETLNVRMNVTGKTGEVTKSLYVITNRGDKTLLVTAKIFPPAASDDTKPDPAMRDQNAAIAKADRQAVFQGDCASCHTKPAEGKSGAALYQAACAICHEAEHRASMVPDLRLQTAPREVAYWRDHISNGREGTLMPAFSKSQRGILDKAQIEALAIYLTENPPKVPTPKTPVTKHE